MRGPNKDRHAERPLTTRLGLALSGGGSRAAAFHRGTVQGLVDVGLLEPVAVVSCVSGGALFGAAWMASRWKGRDTATFLGDLAAELERGFVGRSIRPRAIRVFLPQYTLANVLAETFDGTLVHGMRLKDLPERPALCLNTSVMNTAQVGKFSREGFSSTGLSADQVGAGSNPVVAMPEFRVALAAVASAAFPVGLPPVYLRIGREIPLSAVGPHLAEHGALALADGGILENLGVQTLLKSRRHGTWDVIVSDAGRKDETWRPGGIARLLRGMLMGALGMPVMERVAMMMSSKQDRHMRLAAFGELEHSWLVDAIRTSTRSVGLGEYLSGEPGAPRRRMMFVRLAQTLGDLVRNIPSWRMKELTGRRAPKGDAPVTATILVRDHGLDLGPALKLHEEMGGDARVQQLNQVATNFTALPRRDIEDLFTHARWQVRAMHALYWNRDPEEP